MDKQERNSVRINGMTIEERAEIQLYELLEEFEFESEAEYYQYIVDSKINGVSKQVVEMFEYLPAIYKIKFLNQHLRDDVETHRKIKEMCIKFLIDG